MDSTTQTNTDPSLVETTASCWFLTGPTASGKTGLGIELAELLNAEIISLDSMALYREMDIGTAKPTTEQRRRVPHHMLDLLAPDEEYSLSAYVQAAQEIVAQIRDRGRKPLFVGGTSLYLKSLLRGIFHGPPADWAFRQAIEEEVKQTGVGALHDRLRLVDPLSAAKLHPHDKRRVIRALEVYRITGRPISHLQTQFDEGESAERRKVFALSWPREELHKRINERVDRMFAAGFVDEVHSLVERYGALSRTAAQAVGYREVIAYCDGDRDLDSTIDAVKARTRQFARRQETWLRSLSECRFIPCVDGVPEREVAEQIASS